jgi:hypothetical protein
MKNIFCLLAICSSLYSVRAETAKTFDLQRYTTVVAQCIHDGKRDFTANTKDKANVIAEQAVSAGFKVKVTKLSDGGVLLVLTKV